MRNIDKFLTGLSGFSISSRVKAADIISNNIIKFYSVLVANTPVLTTRTQSNWYLSIGRKRTYFDFKLTDSARLSLSRAQWEIQSFPSGDIFDRKRIYITNRTPYLSELENGGSKQQPSGWIKSEFSRFSNGIGYFGGTSPITDFQLTTKDRITF